MNTSYKSRVPSPFQMRRPKAATAQPKEKQNTLREEMQKLLGTYSFTATFEHDAATANTFGTMDGLVPFICTLKMGDRVVGVGRGATVINQMNRFIVRNITYAYHASLIDAVMRATKLMDVFRPDAMPHPWSQSASSEVEYGGKSESDAPASDKQRSYLARLLQDLDDEQVRDKWMANLDTLTKEEASAAISQFSNR